MATEQTLQFSAPIFRDFLESISRVGSPLWGGSWDESVAWSVMRWIVDRDFRSFDSRWQQSSCELEAKIFRVYLEHAF